MVAPAAGRSPHQGPASGANQLPRRQRRAAGADGRRGRRRSRSYAARLRTTHRVTHRNASVFASERASCPAVGRRRLRRLLSPPRAWPRSRLLFPGARPVLIFDDDRVRRRLKQSGHRSALPFVPVGVLKHDHQLRVARRHRRIVRPGYRAGSRERAAKPAVATSTAIVGSERSSTTTAGRLRHTSPSARTARWAASARRRDSGEPTPARAPLIPGDA